MNQLVIFTLIAVVTIVVIVSVVLAMKRDEKDGSDDEGVYQYEWIATDGAYLTSFLTRPEPGMVFVADGPNGERVMQIVEVNHDLRYLEAVDVTDDVKGR